MKKILCTINAASLVLAALILSTISLSAQGLAIRTVEGKVTADGAPLAGVAVTDGLNIVRTDEAGRYSILTLADTRMVYITIPSGYEAPLADGSIPQFYKMLTPESNNYDFALTKSSRDDSRHVFVVHTDVQVTASSDVKDYKEILADCRQLLDSYGDVKTFATDCGDIVGDSPQFFPSYIKACSKMNIPFFRVNGNHDMDYWGRSFETSYHTFEKYFGPTHYSMDCGKAHYIFINNNFYTGYGINYIAYVPENTFRWLEQDLAGVDKDALVFVFFHIPTAMDADLDKSRFDPDLLANVRQFHHIFKDYDTHFISGHTHFNMNLEFGNRLYEHNTAAACGTWWRTEECMDGTPRGYAVYEVDGNTVKWYYKSSGYPRDYQMRTYAPGSSEEYPGDVIANVWNYDSRWKVELIENGKVTAGMKRFTGYDPVSKAHCSDKKVVLYDWISPITNSHMFHATPKIKDSVRQVRVTDRFGNVYIQDVK